MLNLFKKNKNEVVDIRKVAISPSRDWIFIILFFSVVLVIEVLFNISIFMRVNDGTLFEVKQEVNDIQALDLENLNKANQIIVDRKESLQKIIKDGVSVRDPSL